MSTNNTTPTPEDNTTQEKDGLGLSAGAQASKNYSTIATFSAGEGPIQKMHHKEKGWALTMGTHILTPWYPTEQFLDDLLDKKPMEFLMTTMHVLIEYHHQWKAAIEQYNKTMEQTEKEQIPTA